MRNIAVLSHIADIDGVGAAALVKMKYRIPASNMFFTSYGRKETEDAEKEMTPLLRRRITLFITDLAVEPLALPAYTRIINKVKAHGGKVIVLDHHPWSEEMTRKIVKRCDFAVFGENRQMCATELVRKYLELDGRFVREFTYLVHHTDFFIMLKEKRYKKLAEQYKMSIGGIGMSKSYRTKLKNLRHIADLISKGKFTDAKVAGIAARFDRLNRQRIEKMLKGVYRISDRLAVGFARQTDSTDACYRIIKKEHVDISVVVNLDHSSGSIRSARSNVVKLANAMGGGGHPHASGFGIDAKSYNSFRTKADREKFVRKLENSARRLNLL
jgi:oligoribonuclease NrnB/cAMP/cGMP phosphodiesterase (DHH superfamily)